jgi:hypothetical protein
MVSSGSVDFNTMRNGILRQAALALTAIGSNEEMSATQMADFTFSLNAMTKAWSAMGLHVWTEREATLFPQANQIRYSIGPDASDHVTETYYETAITATEASGQTVLSVDDTTNMTAGDFIGIVLDSGALHWSTVSSKTSTTVTIALATTDTAATGNAVFTYTTKISRPLSIEDARVYNIIGQIDTSVAPLISRQEYNALSVKNQPGAINQIFFEKSIPLARIYLWQPVEAVEDLLKITYHRLIEDFDSQTDTADLPVQWIPALSFGLAEYMLPQYPAANAKLIMGMAAKYLDAMLGDDREDTSVFFQPDFGP